MHPTGAHEVDVGRRAGVAIFEGSFFLGFAPEDFVVAVGIEGWIDAPPAQIDAGIGEMAELFEVVAAVDDAGVQQRGRPAGRRGRD